MGKKIVAILLIATMAMGIAACGGSGDKKDGVGTKHLIFLQWKKLQKFIKKIIKM